MSAFTQPSPAPQRLPVQPAPGPVPVPPVRTEPPRRWRLPLLLAALGLLAGMLYLALRPGQTPQLGSTDLVRTAQATTGPLQRVVRISGQTSARHFATIMVPVFRGPDSGRDLSLMKVAKPGSFVKKGQVVAELDAQTLKDHLDDVNDQVLQSENDVLKKKAEQEVEWGALQQNLKSAKADLDRARLDLKAAEVRTDIERELLRLTADEAEAAYKQLQDDMANKKTADRSELRILEIAVQRQHIELDHHTNDLRRFTIQAPMDGLVVMMQTFRNGELRQVREGDQVFPGMQFMKIVDTRSMQVEGLVSQADSSQFRLGQTATIGLDAFPGLQFSGKIYGIGAMAVKGIWDTYYLRNVPVQILIEGSDPRLIPDLSAWAHIHMERQERATIVPAEAVRAEGGHSVVYVKTGGGYEARPVEIGVRTATHVSIVSGLRPGEEVALAPVKKS